MKNKKSNFVVTIAIILAMVLSGTILFCGVAFADNAPNIQNVLASNAIAGVGRQSHREAKKTSVPVKITLATSENIPENSNKYKNNSNETAMSTKEIATTSNSAISNAWNELDEYTKQYFIDAANEFEIDANMVAAIAYNETRFTPTATHLNSNGTTDWGMMQCNDVTFSIINSYIGISSMSELLNTQAGIRGGCALLRYYADTYGLSGTNLLLAYQEGYGNYQKVMRGEAQPWQAYYNVCQYMSDLSL